MNGQATGRCQAFRLLDIFNLLFQMLLLSDSPLVRVLVCCDNKPPVGFEPTISRLLSGCSAN